MKVNVCFYSYFKELTGCDQAEETLSEGATLEDLYQALIAKFPKLAPMQRSTLIAVGVEYQDRAYRLNDGDTVSLFPPVQGG